MSTRNRAQPNHDLPAHILACNISSLDVLRFEMDVTEEARETFSARLFRNGSMEGSTYFDREKALALACWLFAQCHIEGSGA